MQPKSNNEVLYSCPGKVFILGEYACIDGGPALVNTVSPSFLLRVTTSETTVPTALPFAEQSPGGKFLSKAISLHKDLFSKIKFEWIDPYDTTIGVGSSSAQFLLSVAAVARLQGHELPTGQEVLDLYWETVGASQGIRPSGIDVLAQWLGGPVVARNTPVRTQVLPTWRRGSTFLLAYTGHKAKTHEHLRDLSEKDFPSKFQPVLNELNELTLKGIEAWQSSDTRMLGETLNAYQTVLTHGGLAPIDFTQRLREVQSWPGVLGCKGSGAQGGDCVLLLIEDAQLNSVSQRIRNVGWKPILPEWCNHGIVIL